MVDPSIIQKTQESAMTILSSPWQIIVSFLWLLGIVIIVTWWATKRVSGIVTWKGLAEALKTIEESRANAMKEHKEDDLRMFQEMAERYQKGLEMSAEKFKEGMDLTAKYLQQVTKEQDVIRGRSDTTANDLIQIKSALKVMLPKDVSEKIFQEAS